jgi:hypothetical protein
MVNDEIKINHLKKGPKNRSQPTLTFETGNSDYKPDTNFI